LRKRKNQPISWDSLAGLKGPLPEIPSGFLFLREESFVPEIWPKINDSPFGKENDELLFLFKNYSLSFKFFINQFRFWKILPAFPAGQRNLLSLTQAGPGGEILGPAVRTGKNFAHNCPWVNPRLCRGDYSSLTIPGGFGCGPGARSFWVKSIGRAGPPPGGIDRPPQEAAG
jgi:hypothetical protein